MWEARHTVGSTIPCAGYKNEKYELNKLALIHRSLILLSMQYDYVLQAALSSFEMADTKL